MIIEVVYLHKYINMRIKESAIDVHSSGILW